MPERTTIWANHSPPRSCWRGYARSCGVPQAVRSRSYGMASLELDPGTVRVALDGVAVPLTPMEYRDPRLPDAPTRTPRLAGRTGRACLCAGFRSGLEHDRGPRSAGCAASLGATASRPSADWATVSVPEELARLRCACGSSARRSGPHHPGRRPRRRHPCSAASDSISMRNTMSNCAPARQSHGVRARSTGRAGPHYARYPPTPGSTRPMADAIGRSRLPAAGPLRSRSLWDQVADLPDDSPAAGELHRHEAGCPGARPSARGRTGHPPGDRPEVPVVESRSLAGERGGVGRRAI